jgi:glycosyltransferase involved in cell wall biosynthesis
VKENTTMSSVLMADVPVSKGRSSRQKRVSVCILLENNPAPFDRRVWQEATALTQAGYHVSIISPKGSGAKATHECISGIDVYRHRSYEAEHPLGYALEYLWALVCELYLAMKVYARTHFKVIQACNPPDHLFLVAAVFKLLGVRFIFDHHDLCPELFADKFGKRKRFLQKVVTWCEYLTFRTADVSIATNQSYREIAIGRGHMPPDRIFVVRSCLDLNNVTTLPPKLALKQGKEYLVVYLGVMGPQDGVHLLIESIDLLVHACSRRDTQFVLIGYGTETPKLKTLAEQKKLSDFVKFTGRISDEELEHYLATADVGVAPDPANALNDKSTMNKILHYMAYGIPIVQYDLKEGRRSAEGASLYAQNDDPAEFARQISRLLDSECLRKELGSKGKRRIEEHLNWSTEKQQLLRAYEVALATKPGRARRPSELIVNSAGHSRPSAFRRAAVEAQKYVIITPARDEENHIERTILSVTRQTVPPAQWIIVNDGSGDRTGEIIDKYAALYPWITPLHRTNRGFRQAGGGVVDAFYDGYGQIRSSDWDFIVKLDADLGFSPEYFEICFSEFVSDPHLGIAGGGIYHQTADGLQLEPTPQFHVRGATKIYRRACWEQVGGLVRSPGWDTIDEAKANMLGWRTRTLSHLILSHQRPTGGAEGIWRDSVKNGRGNYIAGYHPVFMLLKCARRILRKPYFVGAAGLFWGFATAYWKGAPRVADRPLINYVRAQQIRRLLFIESIWK